MGHSQGSPEAVYYFHDKHFFRQAQCWKNITWEPPKKYNMAFGLVFDRKNITWDWPAGPAEKKL